MILIEREPALTSLPGVLQRFPKLSELNITENSLNWDEALRTLAGLKTLRRLEVRHQRGDDRQPANFTPLSQLTALQFSGWLIGPGTFAGLHNLKELTLISDQVDPATLQETINQLTNLETLVISSCRPLGTLRLERLKNLKSVELTYNDDLRVDAATLAGLPKLERLTVRSPSQNIDLSGLCGSPRLQVLIIGGSSVQDSRQVGRLPDCLGQLKRLTQLRVEDLILSRLPANIGSLRRLQTLHIRHCALDSLPAAVSQLTALQTLTVYANKLRYLPALGQLRNVRDIDVSNNQLTTLPDDIGQLTQLTTLNLGHNRLSQLPASFVNLTNLKTCWLSNNQLDRLPNGFGKLRNLQSLTISENRLTELSADIGQLTSLQFLSIGKNRLQTLPASFTQLTNLTDLHIGTNELTDLPGDIGKLRQLRSLSLRALPITQLPASFCALTQLQSLQITDTRLGKLPDNIGALTELRFVSLANNELIALPNSIGQWRGVTTLDLTGNPLERLPNGIGQMTNLTELILVGKTSASAGFGGRLRQLPDSIIHCDALQTLTIENQPQLDADDVFGKVARLKNLNHLSVVHCGLTRLPDLDWKTIGWQQLNVAKNQLTELPVGLMDAPSLRHISASGNRLPDALNRDFLNKQTLLSAFAELGKLPIGSSALPNDRLTEIWMRTANEKGSAGDWAGAVSALDKAIEYAPDSMRALPYGERYSMYRAHRQYANASADLDSAIVYTPRLHYQGLHSPSILKAHWKHKGYMYAEMGQYDDALASLAQAERLLTADSSSKYAEEVGSNEMDRGRYLALKGDFTTAELSYRKAIDAYERYQTKRQSHVGIRLKVVELCLLTAQYDRAQQLLTLLNTEPDKQFEHGYKTLYEYLSYGLAILKGSQTGTQAVAKLSEYCDTHPQTLWYPFTLTDAWLVYKNIDMQKIMAFRQLQSAAKLRLIQP